MGLQTASQYVATAAALLQGAQKLQKTMQQLQRVCLTKQQPCWLLLSLGQALQRAAPAQSEHQQAGPPLTPGRNEQLPASSRRSRGRGGEQNSLHPKIIKQQFTITHSHTSAKCSPAHGAHSRRTDHLVVPCCHTGGSTSRLNPDGSWPRHTMRCQGTSHILAAKPDCWLLC